MRTKNTRSELRTAVLLAAIATVLAACGGTSEVSEAGSQATDGSLESGAPTTTIAAEWETIESVEDLASRVDAVVVGVVVEEFARYPLFEPDVDVEPSLINIIHTVVVEEVIANDAKSGRALRAGDQIFVSYPDLGVPVRNITPYRAGDRLAEAVNRLKKVDSFRTSVPVVEIDGRHVVGNATAVQFAALPTLSTA